MINEIIELDKKISKNVHTKLNYFIDDLFYKEFNLNLDRFYSINEEALKKCINILHDNQSMLTKKHKKILENTTKYVNFINFSQYQYINNKEKFVISIFVILIFKIFEKKEFYSLVDLKNDKTHIHSYSVLNSVNENFNSFIKWVQMSISKEKVEHIDYKILILQFILILRNNGILEEKKINFGKKNTEKIWILSIENFSLPLSDVHFISYKYSKIGEMFYLYTNHFSTMTQVFTQNKYSNEIFKLTDESLIADLARMHFWINIDSLTFIYEKKLQFYNVQSEDLEKTYHMLIKSFSKAITEKDMQLYKNIAKMLSIYNDLLKLKRLIDTIQIDSKIFLPFLFDFRGRLYYKSDMSPTFFTYLRFAIYDKSPKISYNNSFISKIKKTIKEHLYIIKKLNIDYEKINNTQKESILWVLLFIAEFEKTSLGKEVKFIDFLNKGIEMFNNFNPNCLNIEKTLHIWHGIKIINEIVNNGEKNWFIQKDSTASVYQILIKSLGYKNKEFLTYCNLQSNETWYDTYVYIIEDFKKNIKLEKLSFNLFNMLFSRSACKKPIMTENYLVTYPTFKKYFYKENENIINTLTSEEKFELAVISKKFFDYLRKENRLFSNHPEIIPYKIKENAYKVIYPDAVTNLLYKKQKTVQKEFIMNKKRETKKFLEIIDQIDHKKFKISSRANYVHSNDAVIMRSVLKWGYKEGINIFGIHDCWLIGYNNITPLIAIVNEKANIIFHDLGIYKNTDNFYSFFIIL
jgi:hypothetical protein